MLMRLLQHTLHLRIVKGHQRPLLQFAGKHGHPNAADSERRGNIHPANLKVLANEIGIGLNPPVQIDHAHDQNQHRYRNQPVRIAL